MSVLCYYHANCVDGFFSALAVYLAKGVKTIFIPVELNRPETYDLLVSAKYENVEEIYFVDVIGPQDCSIKISEMYPNATVVILDHHLTSMKYLSSQVLPLNVEIKINMEKSGAILCYEYFQLQQENLMYYFQLVEDYDLWKFAYPESRQFTEGFGHYRFTQDIKVDAIKAFDRLLSFDMKLILERGVKIVREIFENVEKLLTENPPKNMSLVVGERTLRCKVIHVESFPQGLNDLGNKMAKMAETEGLDPIGVILHPQGDLYRGYVRSLTDSSMIACFFGGGGHACSSGFSCSKSDLEKFIPCA